jgi:hypothetical protein
LFGYCISKGWCQIYCSRRVERVVNVRNANG